MPDKKENKPNRINEDAARKIQELQLFEQNFQNILLQKQTLQLELNDVENALSEMQKNKGDAFKIVGSVMLKTDKNELEKDLKQKKDVVNLRLKNIDKQEAVLQEKLSKLREEVMQFLK